MRSTRGVVVAPEFRTAEFQTYLSTVQPIARRIAKRRSRPHPLLAPEDLTARALEVCLMVWQKYHASKPLTELVPISVRAIDRRLTRARLTALKLGEAEVTRISLDSQKLLGIGGIPPPPALIVHPTPIEHVKLVIWPAKRIEIRRPLEPDEQAVLAELLRPSPATLAALDDVWESPTQRRHRWNWPTIRTRVVAKGLGWRLERTRQAYRHLRAKTSIEFYARPDEVNKVEIVTSRRTS